MMRGGFRAPGPACGRRSAVAASEFSPLSSPLRPNEHFRDPVTAGPHRHRRRATVGDNRVLRHFDGELSVYQVCVLPHFDRRSSVYQGWRFAPLRPRSEGVLHPAACPTRAAPAAGPAAVRPPPAREPLVRCRRSPPRVASAPTASGGDKPRHSPRISTTPGGTPLVTSRCPR